MFNPKESQRRIVTLACDPQQFLVEESHAERTNIHKIMKRYRATGIIEHVNQHKGTYADMATSLDYKESLDLILKADSMFSELPADLRARFENNPGKFVDFMQNPENYREIQEIGLDATHLPESPPKEETQTDTQPSTNQPSAA